MSVFSDESVLEMLLKLIKTIGSKIDEFENLLQQLRNVDEEADGKGGGHTLLFYAILVKRHDMVKLLLDAGASTSVSLRDRETLMPLHYAIIFDSPPLILMELCERVEDINARNGNGDTPAHVAAHYCRKNVLLILKKYGADFSLEDMKGKLPSQVIGKRLINANPRKVDEISEIFS